MVERSEHHRRIEAPIFRIPEGCQRRAVGVHALACFVLGRTLKRELQRWAAMGGANDGVVVLSVVVLSVVVLSVVVLSVVVLSVVVLSVVVLSVVVLSVVVLRRFSRPLHLASRRDASFAALAYRWCSLRSTTG